MSIGTFSRRRVLAVVGATSLGVVAPAAHAQAYPNKPIRFIIPGPPGGGTDAIGRSLADGMANALKQTVVVDNKPGANTIIGTEALTRAPADGYTVLLIVNSHTINPAIVKKLPYDSIQDFTPLAAVAKSPYVLVATASSGVKTLRDLVEYAKARPDKMSFGSAEAGARLAAARFGAALGIPVTNIYYKGTGPIMTDIVGGHLNFSMTSIASALPFRDSGKVNFIAVASSERTSVLAEVPTLAEQGLTGADAAVWWGLVAPARLPVPLVQQLHGAIRAAMSSEEMRKKLSTLAMDSWPMAPDEFAGYLRREVGVNQKAAKDAGIEPE